VALTQTLAALEALVEAADRTILLELAEREVQGIHQPLHPLREVTAGTAIPLRRQALQTTALAAVAAQARLEQVPPL